MRAMPSCSDGPIIDHIPIIEDESTIVKKDTKRRNVQKSTPKRLKSDEGSQTLRRKSSTQNFGVLLSDLLKNTVRSDEDKILDNIKKKHKIKSKNIEVIPEKETTECQETEKEFEKIRKNRNKNKAAVPKTNKPAEPERKQETRSDIIPAPTKPKPVEAPVISKEQSYANYQLFFPELGSSPTPPTSPPEPISEKNSNLDSLQLNTGTSGIEIIKVKKKSKKERQKVKDKPTQVKSEPIEIEQKKTNVWGVPLK